MDNDDITATLEELNLAALDATIDWASAQDNTHDGNTSLAYRSPSCSNLNAAIATGLGSPTQGRSLREFDEKLRALQKENFNLKLRLFLMDEKSPPGPNGTTVGSMTTSKSSDDETLFKQNIDLKVKIEEMRKELEEKQDLLVEAAKAMQLMDENNKKLQSAHSKNVADLTQKIQYLEDELREKLETSDLPKGHSEKIETVNRLEAELQLKINELEATDSENKLLLTQLNQIIDEQKETIYKLELQISEIKTQNETTDSFASTDDVNEMRMQILHQKRELADKLCTIEDMEEKLKATVRAKDKGCKTIQLLLIKTTDLETELNRLKSNESAKVDSSVEALKSELSIAQTALFQEQQWRDVCAEVCGLLSSRLNELAEFLDSLLKQKDVLNVLAQDRHKAMRKAVDNSLDLSRSLSMSNQQGQQGRFSLNEQALLRLSSVSNVLNDSYFAGRSMVSFLNETDGNNSVIENLRTQVKTLRCELERVTTEPKSCDGRREKNLRLPHAELNSDSEEWSEPDRQVSHERIGLDETIKMNAVRSSCSNKYKASSSEEHPGSRLNRKNSVSRLQERITELETQVTDKCYQLSTVQIQLKDNELEIETLRNEIDYMQSKLTETLKSNESLVNQLKTFEIENQSNKLIEEQAINRELSIEIDRLRTEFVELEDKYTENVNQLKAIEAEKETLNQKLIDLKTHADDCENRLHETDQLVQVMRENQNDANNQLSEQERTVRNLKRNLDEATLHASKAVLERTKFMNERDNIEKLFLELKEKYDQQVNEITELHRKLTKLSHDNGQLHDKLTVNETQFQLTRSASQGNARYAIASHETTSCNHSDCVDEKRCENSSPDLGIDSDGTGRSSGTDINAPQSPDPNSVRINKHQLNRSFNNILFEVDEKQVDNRSPTKSSSVQHDCEKVDKENSELRRKLERTRRAFEKTWAQLRISNQRKEQIEKDIRQEIYKTHSVLRNVRTNIENAYPTPPPNPY